MSILLTFVFLLSLPINAKTHSIVDEVVNVLSANGLRRITIVYHQNGGHSVMVTSDHLLPSLLDALSKSREFYMRAVSANEYDKVSQEDFHIFPSISLSNNLSELAKVVSKTKVKMSLVVLDGKNQNVVDLCEAFAKRKQNFFFYAVTVFEKELQWFQVVTMKTGYSINKIQFLEHMVIDEAHFDLKGLKIRSLYIPWKPYVLVSDCENVNMEGCQVEGFTVDVVDLIAKQLNFTYGSTKEPNDDWGYFNGASNITNLTGVLGGVYTGMYDLSLNGWMYNEKRSRVLSFSPITTSETTLVFSPQMPDIDFGLFARPLTASSWRGVVGVVLVIFLANIILYHRGSEESLEQRILAISTGLFFVLLNSFYGGAMTMFFANDITLPFENIHGAIQAYPEWKLLMMQGMESFYQGDDPDNIAFMERVNLHPKDMTFDTIENGIERLRNGHTVIHVGKEGFNYYINNNPRVTSSQRLLVVEDGKDPFITGIIFTLNSPLKPLFDRAITRLREGGAYEFLERRW